MKMITYKGGAATLYEFGHKFTVLKRSIVVEDSESIQFRNNNEFAILDIKEKEVVPNNDTKEDTRKKLLKLPAETLKEMCVNENLDATGTKEVLADRLLNSGE